MFCEAFADGVCVYIEYDTSYADCDGITDYKGGYYTKCCEGGNDCNHGFSDIDTDSCTKVTDNDLVGYWGCLYPASGDSAWHKYVCDDDVDEITCEGVLAVFKQQAECKCKYYSAYYNRISAESQAILEWEIDVQMAQYSIWNYALDCDINLSCDLKTGDVDEASHRVYIVSVVFSVIMYIVS